jgi:hypothetical protein
MRATAAGFVAIPAKAGIDGRSACESESRWIPAFAGMTTHSFGCSDFILRGHCGHLQPRKRAFARLREAIHRHAVAQPIHNARAPAGLDSTRLAPIA